MAKKTKSNIRSGMDADSFREDIKQHLRYTLAKDEFSTTGWDNYRSVVLSVMDRLHDRWIETQQSYYKQDKKRVYYLSMEYLIGRLLDNMLVNLGMQDEAAEAMEEMGLDYDKVRNAEWDAGLGNGGLGRLAACFLDSMATLGIPAIGYGIRYDYGIFYQSIENGFQIEKPDLWLQYGNPWDVVRPKIQYTVPFYGDSVAYQNENGNVRFKLENTHPVKAVAYDTPVPGFKNNVVNNLRLWKAESSSSIDLKSFNQGQYIDAVRDTQLNENISRVLYPNDKMFVGQELRLKQEFFLVSASMNDILRRFKKTEDDWTKLPEKVAIQCNDTHPNLAIPELMRILIDEEGLDWDKAWDITVKTMAYTNHTLMPEALEKWPVSLMRNLLPRHLQIIYEINRRFLQKVSADIGDDRGKISRLSIVGEGEDPVVHMASLGIVGSHKINGVAALHSDLIKKTLFRDFHDIYPERFTNKTNGITPRRWLRQCNRELADLITGEIGEGWVTDLDQLKKIEKFADDKSFMKKFVQIKQNNKQRMADYIEDKRDVKINTESMFDIQIKRIHEYKRQLMLTLYAITQYNRIKENSDGDFVPRTILVAGKAAPGYTLAKLFIKLMNDVGEKINNDPDVGDKLKFLFLENYSVTLAEKMIPAANLSEQISTAGKEASGTGNMKFALNGALTIGTLDGANVEIKEEVGDENIFIFGNTVDDVDTLRREGYNPWDYYNSNSELKKAIDQIRDGFFNSDKELFQPIIESLLEKGDYFLVLADFEAYVKEQGEVDELFKDQKEWNRKALLNTARVGKFSSDRTIRDYAEEIWDVKVDR
ncbi:glycogen/starch/alpha-glucan phosphorylase [Rhodohalobacter sp. SW132]|uniref:glycogen/starch/alpha-glucan phosphorylase n=1 Tax=Rhodohalobacter sp. SW132 TaxID=2293433 RepID=UPI000E25A911|nr:glycogen/starch/alpha-glucan phosphorylase [Rhodohalobacter sp. SW132]REL38780.1 glycogen/starch/alpha-glucan phosphorylase [Rhodohalobacter sp. SW132]